MQNQATSQRSQSQAPGLAQSAALADSIRAATSQIRLARTKRLTRPMPIITASKQVRLS